MQRLKRAHRGIGACAEHAVAVSELPDLDADVVLIAFTSSDELDAYVQHRRLSFPVLNDADRSVYRAYGFGRGSLRNVWGLLTLRRYAEILRRGGFRDLATPTEDTRQLGGDIVIAPDGTLAWGHWGTGPADRPSIDELRHAVKAAGG